MVKNLKKIFLTVMISAAFLGGCAEQKNISDSSNTTSKEINNTVSEKKLFIISKETEEGTKSYGYMDKKGNIVIEPKFDSVGDFSEGLAVFGVVENGEYKEGYIDMKGNIVVDAQFDMAKDFSEGIAVIGMCKENGGINFGYIDKKGNIIVEPKYYFAGNFSEGAAVIGTRDDETLFKQYGYINKEGEIFIDLQFDHAEDFKEGLAYVRINGNTQGYIDKNGNYIWKDYYYLKGEYIKQ